MKDIIIENLNIRIGEKSLFENFNLTVKENTVTGILAPSGSGKTTLLNWVAGLLSSDFDYSPYQNFGSISYVFQEPRLIPNLTVLENVMLPIQKKVKKNEVRLIAESFLEKVQLTDKKNLLPESLSGGEKQRVSIARAFAYPAEILLLDEPLQSQDTELRHKLLELIKSLLKANPRTVLFVSHYEEELKVLCDDIIYWK